MQTTTESGCDYQNILDRKIDLATVGLHSFIYKDITQNVSAKNTLCIVEHILAMKVETNISDTYRMYTIQTYPDLARINHSYT